MNGYKNLITLLACLLHFYTVAQTQTESAASKSSSARLQNNSSVQIFKIMPHDTDSAINTFTGGTYAHFIYRDKSVKPKDELLVFLTGTNGKGGTGREFNTYAATLGYRVLNLIYPDDFSLSRYQRHTELGKYALGREEIITGKDLTAEINVNRANSIENRLIKLLSTLIKRYPNQGWNTFLSKSGEIQWEKIIVAGQSQGGGHAAFLAMKYQLAGVVMLASPKDYNVRYHKVPAWLSVKGKTPLDRYYSFVHTKDDHNACTYEEQQEIWTAMGLYHYGEEQDVDQVKPPYKNTHLLTSTKPQPSPHGSVVHDVAYQEAWKYMLTGNK